jgi:hypothetical protein
MTWVIGMPGFVQRGVLIADARITVRRRGQPDQELEAFKREVVTA